MGGTQRQGTKANEQTPRDWSGGIERTSLGAMKTRGQGNLKRGDWRGLKEEHCRGTNQGDWESVWE